MAAWDEILNAEDRWVVAHCGFGARRGFGSRPALAIIDAQYNFVGERKPARESMQVYPSGIGEKAWQAVDQIERLLQAARRQGIPVVYTRALRSDKDLVIDSFRKKRTPGATQILQGRPEGPEIVAPLAPHAGEVVLDKKYASAFFATPFEVLLRSLGVDTLIVTGFVTAGCIRATVVDAASYNYNVIIPEECVGDRIQISHQVNLLDMDLKYADVMPANEVLRWIDNWKGADV
jgi:maleamate amidohydrolase